MPLAIHTEIKTGSEKLGSWTAIIAVVVSAVVIGLAVGTLGLVFGLAIVGLPMVIFFLTWLFGNPLVGLWLSIWIGFFAAGIARYMDGPWGLLMDILLFVSWLALVFKKKVNWSALKNSGMTMALAWFGFVVLEMFNPESNGFECWFYAMRGVGFYQLLSFGLVFICFDDVKYLDRFLHWMIFLSILGTIWGLRQMIFGVDEAENHWLYAEGFAMTHVLHGVLRVFSFYSDAGQFGASQAMVALICGIIALGPVSKKKKIGFGIVAIVTFIGFAISGTRGALAVPGAGVLVYLFMSRNFKILIAGFLVFGSIFYVLKYTFALQNVEQVRRMRTALDPNDESLQVRLRNQKTFGRYLASRPFGGGIGAAGFWGSRFNPYSLLANTATDSYYVKIWAETGIVGICFHLFMFGFFIGKGGHIIWHLRDPVLRVKMSALFAGMCGVMMSSYGNQVYSQMPTGILMGIAIPLIFIAKRFDTMPDTEGVTD
ncbi:MAG: O-antigen ligase family protein [Saprospiraceae bacterium]|nr:O-antigen ligase family protein [Saprospiraceae bacterium]